MLAVFDGQNLPAIVCHDPRFVDEWLATKKRYYEEGFTRRNSWDHQRYPVLAQYISAYMQHIAVIRVPEDCDFQDVGGRRSRAYTSNYSIRDNYEEIRNRVNAALSEVGAEDVTPQFITRETLNVVTGSNVTAEVTRRGLVSTGDRVSLDIHHFRNHTDRPLEEILAHISGERYLDVYVPQRGRTRMAKSSLGNFQKTDITEARTIINLTNTVFD